MSRLERRYRRLLGVLPRWYRAEREEEMVGTFMADRDDELDFEYGWPGWPEAFAMLALAVRTRFAVDSGPARAIALGNAVRLVALLGLLANAAVALGQLAPLALNGLGGQVPILDYPGDYLVTVGLAAASVLAFVLLVTGRRGAARVLAVAALLPSMIPFASISTGNGPTPLHLLSQVMVVDAFLWCPVVCLFLGFHREAATPSARPWLRALAIASAAAACLAAVIRIVSVGMSLWPYAVLGDLGDLSVLPVLAVSAGVVGLYALRRRESNRVGETGLALACLAVLWLPNRISLLAFVAGHSPLAGLGAAWAVLNAVLAAQVVVLVVAVTASAVLGVRALHAPTDPAVRVSGG
jgi:hypothetical protein